MVSRSTRRGLVVVTLLAAVSFWLTRGDDGDTEGPIEGLDTRLDYALENFEMRAFDERGEQAMRLWAPRLTNDAATKIGRVEQPRIEVRHEGFLWHILADSAIISEDQEEVFLRGEVTLEREGATPLEALDIASSDVTLVVNERIARSDADVRLTDTAGALDARGFEVNLRSNEFQLHQEVRGSYVLPQ